MIKFSTIRVTDEDFLSFQTKLLSCAKNKKIDHFKISLSSSSSLEVRKIEVYVADKKSNITINIYDFDGYKKAFKLLDIALEVFKFCDIKKSNKKLNKIGE